MNVDFKKVENNEFPEPSENGFVYLASCGGLTKAGMTNNVRQRMNSLGFNLSSKNRVVFYSSCNRDSKGVESYLHYKLRNYRVRGEWFNISVDDALSEILSPDAESVVFEEDKKYTIDELREKIKEDIRVKRKSNKEFCAEARITPVQLSQFLGGHIVYVPKNILEHYGFEKKIEKVEITYVDRY